MNALNANPLLPLQLPEGVMPQPCLPPVALHGAVGEVAQLRDLHEREAGEEVEIDEFGQRAVGGGEVIERFPAMKP